MPGNFLLISRPEDTGWPLIVKEALMPLGSVEIIPEKDADERIAQCECGAIVIVDATAVETAPALVSRLRRQCPKCRVVVVTALPTWQRARDAFQAGAVDYIRRLWDSEELLTAIKDILGESLPHTDETL